jgi:hypothetical protein
MCHSTGQLQSSLTNGPMKTAMTAATWEGNPEGTLMHSCPKTGFHRL